MAQQWGPPPCSLPPLPLQLSAALLFLPLLLPPLLPLFTAPPSSSSSSPSSLDFDPLSSSSSAWPPGGLSPPSPCLHVPLLSSRGQGWLQPTMTVVVRWVSALTALGTLSLDPAFPASASQTQT